MTGAIILEFINAVIGFSFLWLKNKGRKSISELREEAEDKSFSIQGTVVLLFIVGVIMLSSTLIFLGVVIIRIVYDAFK